MQTLLGEDTFAQVAARHWREAPPSCADLACWGELPAALADDERLADLPYLAEVARLDDAVAQAAAAADADTPRPDTLLRLADTDAQQPRCAPHPGWRCWRGASRRDRSGARTMSRRCATGLMPLPRPVRRWPKAVATVIVWRQGWAVRVAVVTPAVAAFVRSALLAARLLAEALERAGDTFDFAAWLAPAVADGLVLQLDLHHQVSF